MNEIFESIGAAVRKVADSASLQIAVVREEEKIRRAYQTIGKLYCTRVGVGEDPTGPEFDQQVAIVAAATQEIHRLKEQRNMVPEADFAAAEDFAAPEEEESKPEEPRQ